MRFLMLAPLSLWAVQAAAEQADAGEKKIVFIAGKPSHGEGTHDHPAGCRYLAKRLNRAMPHVKALVRNGWPEAEAVLDGAAALVVYSDGGRGHVLRDHLDEVDALAKRGVGIALLHYAVEPEDGDPGGYFTSWIGGFFDQNWSVNPHWTAEFTALPEHEITRGVRRFVMEDEWYYHMRFVDSMANVTPVLSAMPPKATLDRPDGPHSNNSHVRESVLERKEAQHLGWAYEREDGGRGFGFTGGHYHKNWTDENLCRLILNAACWVAKVDVPEGGVP